MFSPLDFHAGLAGWQLSPHAKERAAARGVAVRQVLAAVTTPEVTYPDRDEVVMTKGRLAVVTNPRARVVLTVLLTGADAWTDADARAVFATA